MRQFIYTVGQKIGPSTSQSALNIVKFCRTSSIFHFFDWNFSNLKLSSLFIRRVYLVDSGVSERLKSVEEHLQKPQSYMKQAHYCNQCKETIHFWNGFCLFSSFRQDLYLFSLMFILYPSYNLISTVKLVNSLHNFYVVKYQCNEKVIGRGYKQGHLLCLNIFYFYTSFSYCLLF